MLNSRKIKVLIVPDKFRPTMTSSRVCRIIAKSLVANKFKFDCIPLADGGEGSLECIQSSLAVTRKYIRVNDPLFRPIQTWYLINREQKQAYIQMAKASGLGMLKKQEKNPLLTTTLGTGQLIKDAIQQQCNKILLMIGGSSTNDGGIGASSALGYEFLDERQSPLSPIGANLEKIHHINFPSQFFLAKLANLKISVATDVNNPLLGKFGATFTFGPQKGATKESLLILERGMQNLNNKFIKYFSKDLSQRPGGGAAGGLGAGAVAFLNAEIVSGVATIMQIVKLREMVKESDLIVTGEGKVDKQTLNGKLIKGVVDLAKEYQKPVVIFCGKAELKEEELGQHVRIIPNQKQGMHDEYCIKNAQQLLSESVFEYFNKFL